MRQNLAYLFYSFFFLQISCGPPEKLPGTIFACFLCLCCHLCSDPTSGQVFFRKNISLHWPLAFTEHLDYSVVDWSILEKTLNIVCFSWPLAVGLFLLRFALVLFGIYSFLMATIFNRWPWWSLEFHLITFSGGSATLWWGGRLPCCCFTQGLDTALSSQDFHNNMSIIFPLWCCQLITFFAKQLFVDG